MAYAVLAKKNGQGFLRKGDARGRLYACGEMRLQRRQCDPAVIGTIEIIAGMQTGQETATGGEAVVVWSGKRVGGGFE